jgi:r-opsin
MVLISIERLLVIRKPFKVLQTQTFSIISKFSIRIYPPSSNYYFFSGLITIAWVYGLIWSVLPFFSRNQYVLEGFKTSCSFDYINRDYYSRVILILMNIFGFFLPILIILICYTFLLVHVKTRYNFFGIKPLKESRFIFTKIPQHAVFISRSNMLLEENCQVCPHSHINCTTKKPVNSFMVLEWKVTKNTCIIIIAFCLAWLPYALISLVGQFSDRRAEFITPLTSLIPALMAKLSAVLNPIIYVFKSRKFKASFIKSILNSRSKRRLSFL